jgi:hypothetical protein
MYIAQQEESGCPGQGEVFSYNAASSGTVTCIAQGQSKYFQNVGQITNNSNVALTFALTTSSTGGSAPVVIISPGQATTFASNRTPSGTVAVP